MSVTLAYPVPSLVVLVGPPCAGKTTFTQSASPTDVIAYDAIARLLHGGDTLDQEHWALFWTVIQQRAHLGCRTYVDATNLKWMERSVLRDIAWDAHVPCYAVAVTCSAETLHARNAARGMDAHASAVIDRCHARFQRALPSLASEGFTDVRVVSTE